VCLIELRKDLVVSGSKFPMLDPRKNMTFFLGMLVLAPIKLHIFLIPSRYSDEIPIISKFLNSEERLLMLEMSAV
jgi:hypothetical protein